MLPVCSVSGDCIKKPRSKRIAVDRERSGSDLISSMWTVPRDRFQLIGQMTESFVQFTEILHTSSMTGLTGCCSTEPALGDSPARTEAFLGVRIHVLCGVNFSVATSQMSVTCVILSRQLQPQQDAKETSRNHAFASV